MGKDICETGQTGKGGEMKRICVRVLEGRCDQKDSDNEPCRHSVLHDEDSGCFVACTCKRPFGATCLIPSDAELAKLEKGVGNENH